MSDAVVAERLLQDILFSAKVSTVSVDNEALTKETFFPHTLMSDAVVAETLLHDILFSAKVSTVSVDNEALTKETFHTH